MQSAVVRFQTNIPPQELFRSLLRICMASNRPGHVTLEFERWFAGILQAPHAVAVSSIRYGLYYTLSYLGFPTGTEVLCTSLTVCPVMEAILLAGYKPVFVDIRKGTTSLDLEDAQYIET